MMVRSSCGRFSCIRFIKSRNLVSVRAVVAICWRKLAMFDYTRAGRDSGQKAQRGAPSIIPWESSRYPGHSAGAESDLLLYQMRRDHRDELSRRYDLGFLP